MNLNWYLIYAYALGVSFFVSLALTALVRVLAIRWNILDHPGERKMHHQPVPLMGGVAIFLTFYGVIFSPHTTLEIAGGSNGKATFYGALNLKKIDTNTSPADFHWDEALKNAFPPAQGCNPPNCKPNQGSWTLQ